MYCIVVMLYICVENYNFIITDVLIMKIDDDDYSFFLLDTIRFILTMILEKVFKNSIFSFLGKC